MKIELKKDQKLFFTSDTHYGHSNICSATTKWNNASNMTRDFDSLEKMNDTIVNNINNTVDEDDILIHLGDWSFGGFDNIAELRSRIVCKNIHLVLGNHDHHIERNKENVQSLFLSVQDYLRLEVRRPINKATLETFKFVCMHYPIASWHDMNNGIIHLHGHVHLDKARKLGPGKMLDVGMDGNDLTPYSLSEVVSLLKNRPNKSLMEHDHHAD